jgi:hypothetical protein
MTSPCVALLAVVAAATPVVAPTATQIADYQIILWTSILLAAILLGVIYVMLGMDSRKDPQLYAQIVDVRSKKQS